jgi:peptide-methionine (S)-S-oxide reductase
VYRTPTNNEVLGSPLLGPWPAGTKLLYLGMGCFWGAERKFWQLPGVVGTAVGYMGGFTANPTYEEVCSGRTGHSEMVMVAYDPERIDTYTILRTFWENHDPTQGYRQGNDVGTQYRSAVYTTDAEQERVVAATRDAYQDVLVAEGLDPITTEIGPADGRVFFPAEDYHQQYLAKNPHGYDCAAIRVWPAPLEVVLRIRLRGGRRPAVSGCRSAEGPLLRVERFTPGRFPSSP